MGLHTVLKQTIAFIASGMIPYNMIQDYVWIRPYAVWTLAFEIEITKLLLPRDNETTFVIKIEGRLSL